MPAHPVGNPMLRVEGILLDACFGTGLGRFPSSQRWTSVLRPGDHTMPCSWVDAWKQNTRSGPRMWQYHIDGIVPWLGDGLGVYAERTLTIVQRSNLSRGMVTRGTARPRSAATPSCTSAETCRKAMRGSGRYHAISKPLRT